MQIKLTEKTLDAIAPPTEAAQAYYWDTEDTGFGVVVGRTGVRTFVARTWVGGKKVKVKIGVASPGPWNVARARRRAKEILGDMAKGINPNAARKQASAPGITLRDAMDLHLAEMQDNNRAEVSIRTLKYDVTRLLEAELDRPLADLTVEGVQRIKERGRQHRTQTNRLLAHLSAIWNTTRRLRRTTFSGENPVGRLGVAKYALTGEHEPERPSVRQEDMPEWLRRVGTLSPIRRDMQMVALFTGLRDANVTTLRWEIVDWTRGGFVIPMSKTTPFTIPFSPTVREILEARRAENPVAFAETGDGGWIFPTINNKDKVVAITETKERRHDTAAHPWLKHGPAREPRMPTGKRVLFLPGLHALRRTFLSVADHPDVGVPKHVQMLLSNHSFAGRDVHEEYVRAEWSSLVTWVGKIDAELWRRFGGRQPRRSALNEANATDQEQPRAEL